MNAPVAPVIDIPLVERLIAANPCDGGAWSTLGVLLRRQGRLDAAVACHRRGLEHTPEHAGIWTNLGNALTEAGCLEAGAEAQRRACALAPNASSSWYNAVVGLRKCARNHEALIAAERGLRLDPSNAQLAWERALTWLQIGDYVRGLEAYEQRRHIQAYRNRVPPGPVWDGGPLDGRTLLLSAEQGFGDALMAARYVPLVRRRLGEGCRIIYERHPELQQALAGLPADDFLPAGAPLPDYDVHVSQMSLPGLFGTTYDTVPPPVSLTVPDAARVKARTLVPDEERTLKIGIVWSGRVTFSDNARRASTLNRFLRALSMPGVRLFSLQKGPPESQLTELGSSLVVKPLGPQLNDFSETAAVIERLDLVVMTDSSVAHLAGSLGRPVWNLVQFTPYWIYGCEGADTPWYPSMRLFRQGGDEDWEPVFAEVRREVAALAAARRQG